MERKEQTFKVINSLNGKWKAQIIEQDKMQFFCIYQEKQIFLIQREKNYQSSPKAREKATGA